MRKNFAIQALLFFLAIGQLLGQCVTASFSSPSSACQQEQLQLTNNSTNDTYYEWDFCPGDLSKTPSLGATSNNIATLTFNTSFELINVDGNWYGFLLDYQQGLFRLDFQDNLTNPPLLTEIVPTSEVTTGNIGIALIKEGDNWMALLTDYLGAGVDLLNFGTNIENISPDGSSVVLTPSNNLNRPMGIEVVKDGDDYFAVVSNFTGGTASVLRFGNSLSSGATVENFTTGTAWGNKFASVCDNWYSYIGTSAGIKQLDFGTSLDNSPDLDDVTLDDALPSAAVNMFLGQDLEDYYLYVATSGGDVVRINLGDDLTALTGTVTNFGDFGVFSDLRAFGGAKNNSTYTFFGIDRVDNDLRRLDFPAEDCGANIDISNEETPDGVYFTSDGTKNITLTTYDDDGRSAQVSSSVILSTSIAPTISFTDNSNECLGQPNTFTPSNLGLVSYEWSFDGRTTIGSTAISPSHTFSQTGDSIVVLTVNDGTCSNFVQDTISIYPEPITPTFSTPGAPYCTGADIAFENLFDESNYNGATLTYLWDYNGDGTSSDRDGGFVFDSEGAKTITLTASIPGCSTPSAGTNINLVAGPVVDFSYQDKCLGDDTQFTNSTSGSGITGQTWNFGDGSGTSSAVSPSHQYAAHGDYSVSLTVNNNQGCSNELILPITVDDKPVALFNHGPSCEGIAIQFQDGSTVGGLANVTNHEWDFDGLGTSSTTDPIFTFDHQGLYDVELIVESSAGCKDTVTTSVNVKLAPLAAFEVDLGCINSETIFLDQSEDDFSNPITQWVWTIDGNLASYSSSFGEVYNESGDHTISLLVKSANSCQAVYNDTFTISELPVANFTTDKACDNELTTFQDATVSTTIVSYSWQFDDEGASANNPAAFNFAEAGDYVVGLTVADETGCEGFIQKTITIHPSPVAVIGASTDIGPAPLTIDFTDESQETSTSFWKFNDPLGTTSAESNPQFMYNTLGDYYPELVATNNLGCSDTASLPITVADPLLDLELVQISTEVSEDKTSISLTVKNSGNVILHGFDIRIDFNNNSSIYESYSGTLLRNQSITYPLNFTFSNANNNIGYACITLIDRIEAFDDHNIVNNEGCLDFDQQLIVEHSYPNPVKSSDAKIRLNMILPNKAPVQLFLMDATGAILYQNIYMDTDVGLNSFFLDVYAFEQGMYFIKVVYDQTASTQRFVKL